MILNCLPDGMFDSNCYILGKNGEGVIIDAGVDAEQVFKAVEKMGLKIKYIILTHGHIDHICSVDELREKLNAKVMIHESDANALLEPVLNGSAIFHHKKLAFKSADVLLKDTDLLEVGGLKLEIIHTPGHSPGCICIKVDKFLFTGDTLFKGAIGRTDFENASTKDIINSIKNKLITLGNDMVIYPGHGEPSTIGLEKAHNPFVRRME